VHKISAVEVEFSLWATDILNNGVAQACKELDIPVVAYSPLGRGFLVRPVSCYRGIQQLIAYKQTGQIKSFDDLPEGDFRRTSPRFQPDVFDKNMQLVRDIQKLAEKKGCTSGQLATGWVLAQNDKAEMPTIIPIPGASSEDRVRENSVVVKLSKEEAAEIDGIIKEAVVIGGRYGGHAAALEYGSSPPLEE